MLREDGEKMPRTTSKRDHHLHIRLNDFEQEELKEIAAETGQAVTDFVRIAILEKKERVRMINEKNKKVNKSN